VQFVQVADRERLDQHRRGRVAEFVAVQRADQRLSSGNPIEAKYDGCFVSG
jgi:hypothetical protein